MTSTIQRTKKAVKVASSEDITFYRVEQSNKKLRIYRHTYKIVEAFIQQDKEAIKAIGNNLKSSGLSSTEIFKS
jgi:hypothetical protein